MIQLVDFFQDKEVDKVLDVGTGSGDFVKILQSIFLQAAIEGVDPNTESLAKAKEAYPKVTFSEMVAENLLFGNDLFDVVSLSMALHHLPKVKKGLKELKRVVKPNGWIIINELFSDNLNPAQEVHKQFHHFRSYIDRLNGISHRETFRKEEILQIIRDAGISVQFYFEDTKGVNQVAEDDELELRVEKMKQMLEKIKGRPEYDMLKPQIEDFRKNALKYGFQPATRVVVVGKKQ
ncbi:MAG TPA: methyltransferase domain-containing protein [Draconibacterium sp.]|nr:methyltransferase domain-containing protein [Draconibacterium sp.]